MMLKSPITTNRKIFMLFLFIIKDRGEADHTLPAPPLPTVTS